jgi:hypothetical protein
LIVTNTPLPSLDTRFIQVNATLYKAFYNIANGDMGEMVHDSATNSLTFNIHPQSDGNLLLILPRVMINSSSPLQATVDGTPVQNTEVLSTNLFRILNVTFHTNTSHVTITGTYVVPEFGPTLAIVLVISMIGIILFATKSVNRSSLKL